MTDDENKQYEHTCPVTPTADFTKLEREEDKAPQNLGGPERIQKAETRDSFVMGGHDRMEEITKELEEGFTAIAAYPKSVTFFGSARLSEGTEFYEKARSLGKRCCAEGFAVITGGGPGIMEAGNRGTNEACGTGVGFNIVLPFEQSSNKYVTHGVDFNYFFTRKFAMNYSGEAYVCFPGGFGTMDEFFQILTLVQTKKVEQIPIVLVGKEFWQPIYDYSKNVLLEKFGTISPEDLDLFTITDDEDEVMEILKQAPLREEYYN